MKEEGGAPIKKISDKGTSSHALPIYKVLTIPAPGKHHFRMKNTIPVLLTVLWPKFQSAKAETKR
jgi:hypothetical protein